MPRRLPPLNALRAFEAAARHLSFTTAANELHVTQAAISYQIRVLEQNLNVPLFRRFTRRLELTSAGETLLPVVASALDRIAEAADRLRPPEASQVLTISLTPSVSAKWLVQRLGRFWHAHREIELRLHHSFHYVDFAREGVDVAIRLGNGAWPDLSVDYLLPANLVPVCSPRLLETTHPLGAPADLARQTLLHETDYEMWARWLRAADLDWIDPRHGPIIDEPSVLIQAAIDGEGVAICRMALVCDDLAAGRLVRPFDLSLDTGSAYYIVCPPRLAALPNVAAFRRYLLAEAAQVRETAGPFRQAKVTANPRDRLAAPAVGYRRT